MPKSITGKEIINLIESTNIKSTNAVINTMSIVTNTTNATLTAPQLMTGHLRRDGFPSTVTDTLGTSATEIVNAIPNCQIGDNFTTTIYAVPNTWNINGAGTVGNAYQFQTGTGISNRSNIPSVPYNATTFAQILTFRFVVANVTSPSVIMHRISNVTSTAS